MVFFSDQILTGRSSGTVIPPPLVRGGQQVSSKHGSQIIMPPLVRGAQVSQREMLTILLARSDIKIIFIYLNLVFVRALLLLTAVSPSETNCREIITLKRRTYDLSLRLSLSVCALCLGAFDVPPLSSTTFCL